MFFNWHSSDTLRRESRAHTAAKADVATSLVTVAPVEGVPPDDVLSFGLAWVELHSLPSILPVFIFSLLKTCVSVSPSPSGSFLEYLLLWVSLDFGSICLSVIPKAWEYPPLCSPQGFCLTLLSDLSQMLTGGSKKLKSTNWRLLSVLIAHPSLDRARLSSPIPRQGGAGW